MIKSVGIDLAGIGEHKVRCLDERAQMCDGFSFETTTAGLEKLEELGIVKELTGQKRNRFYGYAQYIEILNQGTEIQGRS